MKYIVPEYYESFQCKCGKCRHSCCEGWPVRISMKEYYRLLGINCSDQLRAKLDCALKICSKPSSEGYAYICADWRGLCMLHNENGLCALQLELGENSLPEVCRLYPRKTQQLPGHCECSCSNSCEKVVELLMNTKGVLHFEEKTSSVNPEFDNCITLQEQECCKNSVLILQNRSLPLPQRFIALRNYLFDTGSVVKRPDKLSLAFQLLHVINECFSNSNSIHDYCRESQMYYCMEGNETLTKDNLNTIAQKYIAAAKHLEAILPDWQIYFEQLIVNHMIYNDFPYNDKLEGLNDEYLSLVIMYSFLRFHLLGYMSDKTDMDKLVDFLAAMFRLIEHSDFKYIVVNLFKEENYSESECVPQLLYI